MTRLEAAKLMKEYPDRYYLVDFYLDPKTVEELLKYIECFAKKSGGYIAYTLHSGYAGAFGAEKEQKIHEIYDKHWGRD